MRSNGPGCNHVQILLGVYVLGGLRGHQETRVRTHLARCARCRAEYEELAEVPALLDMITSEDAAEAGRPAGPPGVPGENAVRSAARTRATDDETAPQADGAASARPAAAPANAAGDGADWPSPLPLRRAPTLAEPG